MPSAYWTGHPLLTWDPLEPTRHVLIYPADPHRSRPLDVRHVSGSGRRARDTTAAPSALLGATRAAVLAALRQPGTSGSIARHLGIAASQHTSALRDAGLIESRRRGKSVEHRLTHLGDSLLTSAGRIR